jgi:large subunit ribosomal protein L25
MDQHHLAADTRTLVAGRHNKRLRREGKVPAVVYGGHGDQINLTIDNHQAELILRGSWHTNAIFNLKIDEGGAKEQVIIRDMQRHPVNYALVHVDFQRVNLDETLDVEVSIHEVGKSPLGVRNGGVLEHVNRTIWVRCKPLDMPSHIDLDLSDLDMNQTLHVSDLKLPEGIEVLDDPDKPLFSIVPPGGAEKATPEVADAVEGETATEE